MSAGSAGYVVVTIAHNGIVHVYGGPHEPFRTAAAAKTFARQMEREDRERYPGAGPVQFLVRKILTDQR